MLRCSHLLVHSLHLPKSPPPFAWVGQSREAARQAEFLRRLYFANIRIQTLHSNKAASPPPPYPPLPSPSIADLSENGLERLIKMSSWPWRGFAIAERHRLEAIFVVGRVPFAERI